MKITPLEIRQKTFEKNFRGYDKDEVTGYLQILSQEWEKLMDENKELAIKLKSTEREVEKLREVENSLFKTLKTAEDTGANIMDQATKAAELHMKETEMKAEALLNDARNKARDVIEEAEMQSKETFSEVEGQVKTLAKLYHTLEDLRDDLLSDIKAITTEINQKLDRAKGQVKHFDIDQELVNIRKSSVKGPRVKKNTEIPAAEKNIEIPEVTETKKEEEQKKKDETATEEISPSNRDSVSNNGTNETKKNESEKSFFDDIE